MGKTNNKRVRKHDFVLKDENQEYAKIIKMLGNLSQVLFVYVWIFLPVLFISVFVAVFSLSFLKDGQKAHTKAVKRKFFFMVERNA